MKAKQRRTEQVLGGILGLGLIAGCAALAKLDSWTPVESDSTVVRTYLAAAVLVTLVLGSLKIYEAITKAETKQIARRASTELSMFKDELIGDVAHELRTPLTGIVGYAQVLEDSVLDGPNGEAVAAIVGQAAELSRLIDDRVTAARLAADTLTLESRPCDVRAAATQAADFLALHGVVVAIDCDEGEVTADPEGLRHILRNLLINAHHHGRPSIVVRGRVWEQRYVLQVIDHGRGAGGDVAATLQASGRRKGVPLEAKPLGLGLANARALALKMEGDLSYRHLGGETHFVVTLPMYQPLQKGLDGDARFEIPRRPRRTRKALAH